MDNEDDKKPVDKAEKKTTKKKEKDGVVKNTIDINPTLNEAKGKTVVLGWGRMNPITSGHEKLANKIKEVAKKRSATPLIYLTHSQDSKKNPLSYDDKIKLAQMAFGRNLVVKSKSKTIFQAMKELESKFDNVVLVAGADRVSEFETLLNKYNGKDYNFESIEVVSAGERTDPDSDEAKKMTADTMSASVMRRLASEGDVEGFKKGLPKKLQSKAKAIFDMVRGGMKLAELEEELQKLDEVLDRKARIKRARTMRRYKTKIANARRRVMRRSANKSRLTKRSRRKAVNLIKRRVAGKRGGNYNSLGVAQKMVIDKKVAKRKAVVSRIAKKNLPKVRQMDRARRTRREEIDLQNAPFVKHEVEVPKKKRFHKMYNKEGTVKLDKRFRAFKPKQHQFEDIQNDLELLNLIEQIHEEVTDEGYMGHDRWGAKKIASITLKRGKYKKALELLKSILDRKKNDKGNYPHTTGYYAATVAKQFSGVDPRTLENMLEEEGGAGDWGTDELVRRYMEDTPGETPAPKKKSKKNVNEMFEEQILNEDGRFIKAARERIKRMEKDLEARKDDMRDRARTMDTALKNRQTEEVDLDEEVSQKQLDDLEKFADRLLQKFDIDVEFTRHFADRMNDDRNKPAITVSELQRLFKKIAKEKGSKIKKHGDAEAVIKDMQSDLNLPVVVNYKNGEFELVNKTIMRKKNFKTTSPEVKYEEVDYIEENKNYVGRSMSTGKYHMTDNPNTTFCNYSGQSRSARNRPATHEEIEKASDSSFCKKCFPNGKPTTPRIKEEVELDELKVDIPDKKNTLDIPRHKMPQVASKDYDELVSYLSQKGLKLQKKKVKASTLKPAQSNFNVDKVVGGIAKMKTMNQTKPLIVSSDNYIIDGHHRWLSVKNTGGSLDIIQANVPVKELLKHVKEFPKAFTRTLKD